jgi:SAM-dependent methyltransferase
MPRPAPEQEARVSRLEDWGRALAAWAIPEDILAAAPTSPWGFPAEVFRRRAEVVAAGEPATPTTRRALEALPAGGTVLDVGCGAGATSLPLAGRASRIAGIDPSEEMLSAFVDGVERAGAEARAELGTWPDVAPRVDPADVVVCGHVLYNVQELGPFARALDDRARSRAVIEITGRHPLHWMNDLWLTFHGIERPSGPTADDAQAALADLGLEVRREDREAAPRSGGFARREDAIAFVRQRLCLPAERDGSVAEALGDRLAEREGLWSAGPPRHHLVTLWWDGPG